ncbi:hypothetical protein Ancab_000700 [Ancistrocladus abbreviatus]
MSDDGDDRGRKKRLAVVGISSMLLVALVVAAAVEIKGGDSDNAGQISTSTQTVQAICQLTDYRQTCESSLSSAAKTSSDTKELVKAAFKVAMDEINKVSKNSTLLKELKKDPRTKNAVDDCKELFEDAIQDFNRSINQIGHFDLNNIDKILSNLRIWLSATITYQETCLDGFENSTGDAGKKVRKLLNTSMEMSSNGLAIITEMSSLAFTMQLSLPQRRLMSVADDMVIGHAVDDVVLDMEALMKWRRTLNNRMGRTLLSQIKNDDFHVLNKDGLPDWLDKPRRMLLHAKHPKAVKPHVVVAKDGSGKYKTIAEALKEVPKWNKNSFIIYVKEGVYQEYLQIDKGLTHLVLIGDGPTKTRITYDMNFKDGTPTFKTATLSVLADHFMAKDIGIENTAGPIKHQAVALRVQSDMSIFYNCHFDGYQDTLYTHTYRQFYRDCRVSGTIDFIFGDAAAFFQNCTFAVRKPLDNQNCIVTAQGRKERRQPTGIVIHNSTIVSDPDYFPVRFKNKAYLARPWKEYSKTIFMESYIEDLIQPEGWLPWDGPFALDTCYYGEYMNTGPGSNMTGRAKWRGVKRISPSRAEKFMPSTFFGIDAWIIASGVPYTANLTTNPAKTDNFPLDTDDEDPHAPSASPSKSDADKSSSSSSKRSSEGKSDHDHDHNSSSKTSDSDRSSSSSPKSSSDGKSVHNSDTSSSSSSNPSSKGKSDHDNDSSSEKSDSDTSSFSSSKSSSEGKSDHKDDSSSKKSSSKGHEPKSHDYPSQTISPYPESSPSPTAAPSPGPSLHLATKKLETTLKQAVVVKDFERALMEEGDDMAQDDYSAGGIANDDYAPSPTTVKVINPTTRWSLGLAQQSSGVPSLGPKVMTR